MKIKIFDKKNTIKIHCKLYIVKKTIFQKKQLIECLTPIIIKYDKKLHCTVDSHNRLKFWIHIREYSLCAENLQQSDCLYSFL